MVKIMENPIKMDDLGGFHPLFSETSIWNKPKESGRYGPEYMLHDVVNHPLSGMIIQASMIVSGSLNRW